MAGTTDRRRNSSSIIPEAPRVVVVVAAGDAAADDDDEAAAAAAAAAADDASTRLLWRGSDPLADKASKAVFLITLFFLAPRWIDSRYGRFMVAYVAFVITWFALCESTPAEQAAAAAAATAAATAAADPDARDPWAKFRATAPILTMLLYLYPYLLDSVGGLVHAAVAAAAFYASLVAIERRDADVDSGGADSDGDGGYYPRAKTAATAAVLAVLLYLSPSWLHSDAEGGGGGIGPVGVALGMAALYATLR